MVFSGRSAFRRIGRFSVVLYLRGWAVWEDGAFENDGASYTTVISRSIWKTYLTRRNFTRTPWWCKLNVRAFHGRSAGDRMATFYEWPSFAHVLRDIVPFFGACKPLQFFLISVSRVNFCFCFLLDSILETDKQTHQLTKFFLYLYLYLNS